MASSRAVLGQLGHPSDMLITLAPWATAQSMPLTTFDVSAPPAENTSTGMMFAPGAIPAPSMPLSEHCATEPATWEPCPSGSVSLADPGPATWVTALYSAMNG